VSVAAGRRAPAWTPRAARAAEDPAPVALRSATGAALVATTVLASMVGFLNARGLTVAVPAIGRDLRASVAALQWVVTAFLVAVAALLLLSGALADRFGRLRLLRIGLLVMLAASVLCAVAPSPGALIAARIAQGVGGAMVIPSSLALLNGSLRPADRARGIGVWAAVATLGATAAPLAGGWLVDHASWRWIFLLNVPLVLAALVTLRRLPEPRTDAGGARFDVPGAILAIVALGGVVYALNEGPMGGWLGPDVLVAGAAGLVAAWALVPVERGRRAPMLRLSLFASRQFDAINVTTLLFYGALSAAEYLLVLQCQLTLGYSAAGAGAVLVPQAAVYLLVSPLGGALVARVGPRRLMVAGLVVVATAVAWSSQARPGASYTEALLGPALLWGLGAGLVVAPLTAAVLTAAGDRDLGEASAVNNAASLLGAIVAIAVVPALIGVRAGMDLTAALAGGYEGAMLALAAVCGLAALVTALFVTDERRTGAPRFAPPAPGHGCALPVPGVALGDPGADQGRPGRDHVLTPSA
jgi:EmrB/QacA subfamily drug resistance transporter